MRFNGNFMRLGPNFRQSQVIFFFSMFLRHNFIYVPADFGKVLLALIYGGNSKSRVFKNIYT